MADNQGPWIVTGTKGLRVTSYHDAESGIVIEVRGFGNHDIYWANKIRNRIVAALGLKESRDAGGLPEGVGVTLEETIIGGTRTSPSYYVRIKAGGVDDDPIYDSRVEAEDARDRIIAALSQPPQQTCIEGAHLTARELAGNLTAELTIDIALVNGMYGHIEDIIFTKIAPIFRERDKAVGLLREIADSGCAWGGQFQGEVCTKSDRDKSGWCWPCYAGAFFKETRDG